MIMILRIVIILKVDDNLNSEEEKTSILEQIKSYQSETRDSDVKENKSKEHGR